MKEHPHTKIGLIGAIVFIALIIILGLISYYPVRIVDALTSETAAGFSVYISPWRILLEPITGPLLFTLRADQPLLEFLTFVVWVILATLVFSLLSRFRKKPGKPGIWKLLLQWFTRVPIIVIIGVGLLLIIIFAPLPSNTIVNHHNDVILTNVHCHSFYSHDGLISTQGLMNWHKRNGFDAFFITDHNHHKKTLEFVHEQKLGQLPADPLVMCGEEFSGSNHILLLGLKRDFRTKKMPDTTAIDSAHANDGVAIVAHWFADERRSIQYYIECGVDGFEIANQAEGISYNRQIFQRIVAKCKIYGLSMVGACDYHGYGSACFTWNTMKIPYWHKMNDEQKRTAILDILRQRDQSKIKVLLYRDRKVFPRNQIWLSPLYSYVGYFRSLNFYQVLSWINWIILLWFLKGFLIKQQIIQWLIKKPLRLWGILGLVSALFVATVGIVLLFKARPLVGYNKIFSEYGNYFLWYGLGFAVYSIILIVKTKSMIGYKN